MQVCTMVRGKTAVMASGKPFRPSTTANRRSSTPRFLSSFMTRSQNLAPSVCSIHRPRTCLWPSQSSARARDGLVPDHALVADLDPKGIEEEHRVDRIQGAVLPFAHLIQDGIGDPADQVR